MEPDETDETQQPPRHERPPAEGESGTKAATPHDPETGEPLEQAEGPQPGGGEPSGHS